MQCGLMFRLKNDELGTNRHEKQTDERKSLIYH